ncbi:hypothetical protein M3Y97_00727000 [Aphelenchoides bicaudatus]|nr:hypothetical protein M3Y97_00727000 [Aphelenchoides bicaudatus]
MSFFGFGQSAELSLRLDDEGTRKTAKIRGEDGAQETHFLFYDGESVNGELTVKLKKAGQKLEHQGIRIELIGQIEVYYDRGNQHDFLCISKELARPGELTQNTKFSFAFSNVSKPYESYVGINVKVKYFLRAIVSRRLTDVTQEMTLIVHTLSSYPDNEPNIKMEVGIEDCLHIEFEYNKSKYDLVDVIIGKIYFLLVRIKIKNMELSIMRRESVGSGPSLFHETDSVGKFEIMDGSPVKGESIPIRLFLAGYDLTPTMREIGKRFSVRYYLNLVLVDEEDRRYFKQHEIVLFRRAEKLIRKPLTKFVTNSISNNVSNNEEPAEDPSRGTKWGSRRGAGRRVNYRIIQSFKLTKHGAYLLTFTSKQYKPIVQMLDKSKQPLDDLIHQLNIISAEEFSTDTAKMHCFKNYMSSKLVQLFNQEKVSDLPDKQLELTRLDNMLMAEGVIGPERQLPENSNVNHADYSIKLAQIRQCYHDQIVQNEETEANFAPQVALLLQEQKITRPITDQEMNRFIEIIRQKFISAQINIKQCACEKVIESKSKFFDARRKRRNFSKQATEILNGYFNSHIENPYPDDATKELLARQCNISVGQVTNWFGNKRIRYKKSIPKLQMQASTMANQPTQYDMLSGMFNPYFY